MNPYSVPQQQGQGQSRPVAQPSMHPPSWLSRMPPPSGGMPSPSGGMPPPPGVVYPGMPQPGQHQLQMGRPTQIPPLGYMRGPPLPHTAPPGGLPRPMPTLNPVPPPRPTPPILPRPPGPPQPVSRPAMPRVALPTATPPVAPLPKINMPVLPPPAQLNRLPVPGEKGHTTVYVGKISTTIDDLFLRAVLELCGPVRSWKRAEDPTTGTPKGFGFCEFETADGVLRALRLLNKYLLDGQELVLNVNQATRDYLERYVQRRKEFQAQQKSSSITSTTELKSELKSLSVDATNGEAEVAQEDQASDMKTEVPSAAVEVKCEPVAPSEGAVELQPKIAVEESEVKADDPKRFGLVDEQDEDHDARAVQKLQAMLDERALVMPVLPPPPTVVPPANSDAVPSETGLVSDSNAKETDASKVKEVDSNADGSKLDEDSASGLKKATPEPEVTETSSIDKIRKEEKDRSMEDERDQDDERDLDRDHERDRRHRDRDRNRDKDGDRDRGKDREKERIRDRDRGRDRDDRDRDDNERALARIESTRERQRLRRERDRELGAREAERLYEEMERDWERREKEKEILLLKEKEREKEKERDRRWEIKQQEEESDDEDWRDRSRWSMRYEEKRKRRQREREEDELDRLMEEQEAMEAKRRRLEEEEVAAAAAEVNVSMEVDRQQEDRELPASPLMGLPPASPVMDLPPAPVMEDLSPASQHDVDTKMEDVEEEGNEELAPQPQDAYEHSPRNGNSEVKVEIREPEPAPPKEQLVLPALKREGSGVSGSGKVVLATVFSSGHDEDEEEGLGRKLRPLVPLEYSEEEKRGALNPPAGVPMPPPVVVPDLAAAAEFARSITAKVAEAKLQDAKDERKDKSKGRRDQVVGGGSERERREKDQPKAKPAPPLMDAKALIDSIPKTKDELFSFPVNWEVYDKFHLVDRMRPWISKKILEFLGEEESTLVDFIVNNIAKHTNAVEMLGLLENIIDEEAEMFVLKMWRMLIFEIRRVETGLAKG